MRPGERGLLRPVKHQPEVESGGDGPVGAADVLAGEAVAGVTLGGATVQVAVPLDQNADGGALVRGNTCSHKKASSHRC